MAEMDELRAKLDQVLKQNDALVAQNIELQSKLSSPVGHNDTNLCSIKPKLAPFWLDRPAGWFAHVEAQFALARITADETKYNYVVSHIDSRLSRDVEDLVTNPPPKGQRYEWIKEQMIKRFSASEAQRVRQLISGEELGDRKPTQFLRHLRSLSGKCLPDERILRELWLQRLPRNVQEILTAQSELPLDKVAEIADKILEVSPLSASVSAVQNTPTVTPSELTAITTQIASLAKQVAALTNQARSKSRSPSRHRSRTGSRPSSDNSRKLCWYHRRWSDAAQKCVQPCDWSSSSGNTNSSQ